MSNYITIKLRRGTQAQWAATNPVLAEGEFGAETDTRKFKIGNGVTAWNSLSYWGSAGGGAADFTDLGDVPASYTGQGGKFVKVKSTEDGLEFGTLTIAAADLPSGIDAAKIANGSVSNTEFQYLDGVTSPIQTQINNRVPYVGASGDVNLGEYGIQLGNLEFDNTPTNTPATDGSVFWDDGDGTLQLQMKGGSVQKVGMNTFARVYNDSGVQIVKGDVVYISGAQGNRIAAKKAQANSETTSKGTIGFCVETIASGAEGVVITEGPLYNLNTFGLTAGQTLYLSATTAGAYTTTAPQAPDHIVILATVERVHATAGSIYVKVDNGYELEELHDVDLTESKATPVDADALLLQDSADSSIWKRLTWANLKATAKTYFDTLYANIVHTHVISDVTNLQTTLDGKVDENAAITGATKTKITYDAKGLVTAGADATTADIADSSNKRYVTDAQLTVIGNTSGTNTGDQTITLTGDVTGSGTGSFAATIANGAVTNAKVATGIDAAKIADGTVSNAEFQTLDGVTSSIQTQINGKANSSHTHSAADITSGTLDGDRLPGLSATKRGGVPATGTPSGLFLKDDGTWATPATGGVTDGDKGDITVSASGATWTIDNDVVSYAKIQNVSAASRLLGRGSASGSGDVEEITIGTGLSLSGTTLSATGGGGGADGTVLSPSQITAWQNNYNPSGWANTVGVLRINANAFHFLSGLTATSDGHTVRIFNTGTSPIGLYNQNTDSTAANRFSFDDQDAIVLPGNSVELFYDGTDSRWKLCDAYAINQQSFYASTFFTDCNSIAGNSIGAPGSINGTGNVWTTSGGAITDALAEIYPGNRVGVIELSTSTSTSGRSGFYPTNNQTMLFHDGTGRNYMEFRCAFRTPANLSDATDNYLLYFGFLDSVAAEPSDGAYLRYNHANNSGNWETISADAGVRTVNGSSTALTTSQWSQIRVVMYPNNTAEYYLNGVSLGRNTTNLPGNSRGFTFGAYIRKSAGTNARTMLLDSIGYNIVKYTK